MYQYVGFGLIRCDFQSGAFGFKVDFPMPDEHTRELYFTDAYLMTSDDHRWVGIQCYSSQWMNFLHDCEKVMLAQVGASATRELEMVQVLKREFYNFLERAGNSPFRSPVDDERVVA